MSCRGADAPAGFARGRPRTSCRIPPMARGLLPTAALALLVAGCVGTAGPPPPRASDEALTAPVREVLPNGLRLIVQDHRASDIVAIYADRRNLAPRIRAFIDYLVEWLGSVPPWERAPALARVGT